MEISYSLMMSTSTNNMKSYASMNQIIQIPYSANSSAHKDKKAQDTISTKTTRDHYSSPSLEQMRAIANKKNEAIPDEPQLWPDDEEEMAKILGF